MGEAGPHPALTDKGEAQVGKSAGLQRHVTESARDFQSPACAVLDLDDIGPVTGQPGQFPVPDLDAVSGLLKQPPGPFQPAPAD